MQLWGDHRSGNCYKCALTAAWLGIDLAWVDTDVLQGQTRTPEFLQHNPNGKIPLLVLDDGRCLSESNAIVNYLAHGSALLPTEPYALAVVQQWQFFEQYSHEPHIAVARFIRLYQGMPAERQAEYEAIIPGGYRALDVMETQLEKTAYLTGERVTVADLCLFAYTHVAADGGFDLAPYRAIQRWLQSIQAQPQFVPMGHQRGK
ncbi:glutathione S-transferase family protein [Marinicella meishanensis]|uniref:glutathione S-transferase family protein n=1 Tax=Marinicella meishanensis TaxID=2873263 RepID=UPI001CBE35EF|nr:glutathione S-transferase family protein [Marinicella sp. NBU2979]